MYTEEKIIRLVQPDGVIKETQINQSVTDQFTGYEIGKIHDVTSGRYDIVIVSGSTMPSNRWAQLDTYMQMYQAGLIDQMEVLKKTEVVDTEGVMERMSLINQLQQQNQQLQEELKKVTGDLQTASREEVHAKKRLEVEKFKSGLENPKEKIKAAVSLYDARLQDELQKAKESVTDLQKVKPSPEVGKS
jgi:glutamate-1-semialdehyde aminotransferase